MRECLIGSLSARSDSRRLISRCGISCLEPVIVTIDSLSLESPLLCRCSRVPSIVPGPNRFRSLDHSRWGNRGSSRSCCYEWRWRRRRFTLFLTDRRSGARRPLVTFQ